MSGIVVVYELDKPITRSLSPGTAAAGEPLVRRVHAAPSAPGASTTAGPRTLCGKDTFAMETARRQPAEHPTANWFPPEYASVVCSDCDAVIKT